MSAPSSTLRANWSVGSEQSAISLSLRVLLVPTSSPLVIVFPVTNSVRPIHFFGPYCDPPLNPDRASLLASNARFRAEDLFATSRSSLKTMHLPPSELRPPLRG